MRKGRKGKGERKIKEKGKQGSTSFYLSKIDMPRDDELWRSQLETLDPL